MLVDYTSHAECRDRASSTGVKVALVLLPAASIIELLLRRLGDSMVHQNLSYDHPEYGRDAFSLSSLQGSGSGTMSTCPHLFTFFYSYHRS